MLPEFLFGGLERNRGSPAGNGEPGGIHLIKSRQLLTESYRDIPA